MSYGDLTTELGIKRRDDPAFYGREWRKRNKSKSDEYQKAYYHEQYCTNPAYRAMKLEASKVARRKKKYNITREQYAALLKEQDGCCSICSIRLNDELRVDHNHKTGKVRALLCANCNSGIGLLKEDPAILKNAAEYIIRHNSEE